MINPLVRQLARRIGLSDDERNIINSLIIDIRDVKASGIIVASGVSPKESCLIIDGLACRFKSVPRHRRQITALHIPGDFVDLHSFILKRVDHPVAALSDCRIGVVPHAKLLSVTERHPRLARLLWYCTLLDGATHREWVAALGHLEADARFAHLVCELFLRLRAAGQTNGKSFVLPITQARFAEAIGISNVHFNRVLQRFRTERVIQWQDSTVLILDWRRLCESCYFDPSYLHLTCEI